MIHKNIKLAIFLVAISSAANANQTTSYRYDSLGRLVNKEISGGQNNSRITITSFDAEGSRTSFASGSGNPCTITINDREGSDEFNMFFNVSQVTSCPVPVTVNFETENGTAIAGTHFYGGGGSIVVRNNDPYAGFEIWPVFGSIPSGQTKTFSIKLSIKSGKATLNNAHVTGTIFSSN